MTLSQKRMVILILVIIVAAVLGRLAVRAFMSFLLAVHCLEVTSYEK
ncbi:MULTISPECIES: hypothetical protein [Paenibacillus]|nr:MULTISPECIES: hypothetical protein [Paenibacillus]KAF6583019.1 hypothetical protein G9G57_15150 [Paenibacillus sp. EKM211P]